MLIDRVVCEVHKVLLVVGFRWLLILDRAESSESFITEEGLDGIQIEHAYIHAKVKLEPVQEEWLV